MYTVKIENIDIGTTRFEFGDPPMGVVMGKLILAKPEGFFEYLVQYVRENSIQTTLYEPDVKCIATMIIPELKVYRNDGAEISGIGANIEGIDSDGYEITISGISYPFYGEEFPHHVEQYNKI
jgi:hypothetical protein